MSDDTYLNRYLEAVSDFRRARSRAKLEQVASRLRGESDELLEYEEVRKMLRVTNRVSRGLQDIPIDAIVGSVGRYSDFTRTFLPRQDADEGRWAKVRLRMTGLAGLPPIEVYQIDQAYFVLDGNHRVSVARRLGATHIQAYVTEVESSVPLSPDVRPDELILKAEYADFLSRTQLDRLCPEADLSVSIPGQYQKLEEHISVHRYFMGIDQKREIPYDQAVTHWYEKVYLPVAHVILERGILRDFPDRTEVDLYLWVMKHRTALAEELGWEVKPESAATDLAARFSLAPQRVAARVRERILETVAPEGLVPGPVAGDWRQEHLIDSPQDRLFADILIAIDGTESGWHATEWALDVARREQARLVGLHVAPPGDEVDGEAVHALRAEFEERCSASGISGRMTASAGQVPRLVCDRARLADLVVLSLSHPYAPQPLARLGSGLRTILRRCPTPVVAVPKAAPPLRRMLLAYDGSPKAEEALFVATYVAGRWEIPLVVLTVTEDHHAAGEPLTRAQGYLEAHGVQAVFVQGHGPAAEFILSTAEKQAADLIVMGGFGFGPILEFTFGSTVEWVLRSCIWPVLVCQ